jgi:type IV pilus biogenesis protein CpaD/CtpE
MRRNVIAMAVATLLALLAGCTTPPTTTVKVPIAVQCRETVPERPIMPTESFKVRPLIDEYVKASQAEIERREGYEGKLRAALEACTAPITP